jgi:hypothetical protein
LESKKRPHQKYSPTLRPLTVFVFDKSWRRFGANVRRQSSKTDAAAAVQNRCVFFFQIDRFGVGDGNLTRCTEKWPDW